MTDELLLVRLRAVCCVAWGIPPWEFDAAMEGERIAAEDAIEALLLRASEPMSGEVLGYLFRERAAERRKKIEAARELVEAYRAETDEERRAAIARELRRLNGKE